MELGCLAANNDVGRASDQRETLGLVRGNPSIRFQLTRVADECWSAQTSLGHFHNLGDRNSDSLVVRGTKC